MKLFHPCTTICLSGQTGAGKTSWVYKFMQEAADLYTEHPPVKYLYCYGCYQNTFDKMEQEFPNLTLHEGVPSRETIEAFADGEHNVVLLDDLMNEVVKNEHMETLFTQWAHHKKLTVIFICQNLFVQGRHSRSIGLNVHVQVLFRNMRGGSQIASLGRELYPRRSQVLIDAYRDATSRPFGYLIIDMSPYSCDQYRLRTNIFTDEGPTVVYVPRQ